MGNTDLEGLEKIKNALLESPLFNLSLTNKELFHSNFLAWFGKKYRNDFKKLINSLLGLEICPEEFSIDREFKHFDICIKNSTNEPKVIIENKVKSVPTKEQLDRYRNDVNDKTCQFVLLTMTSHLHDMRNADGWNIITYKDLANKLVEVKNTLSNSYHKKLLEDYCDYVANLQNLISYFDSEGSYFSGNDGIKIDAGIHDICGKRKAQILYQKLKVKCEEKHWPVVSNETDLDTNKIMLGWGFTNSQPLVEVKLKSKCDDIIVIQIQGKQYRHAVEFFDKEMENRITKKEKNTNNKKSIVYIPSEKGLNYLIYNYSYIFTSFDGKCEPRNYPFIPNKKRFGQTDGYCKYCNGNQIKGKISCFVYQWVDIPDSITLDQLVDYIVTDTEQMKSNRDQSIQK